MLTLEINVVLIRLVYQEIYKQLIGPIYVSYVADMSLTLNVSEPLQQAISFDSLSSF